DSCADSTAAYTFSGTRGAVRGFTGQVPAQRVAARAEVFAFPAASDARKYLSFSDDLERCIEELSSQNLPAGSKVSVERVPKKGTGKPGAAQSIRYVSTVTGADGSVQSETAVEVMARAKQAASLFLQRASSDTSFDVDKELDAIQADLEKALAAK